MEEVDITLRMERKATLYFAYSPYVYRISADIYQSSVGAKYYGAGIDLPYFKESPYRINFYSFYDRNLRGNTMESAPIYP